VALLVWVWAVPGAATAQADDEVKVRGQVLDPDGKPLSGAKLYLGGFAGSAEPKYPVRATSGNDGRFEFSFTRSELGKADADDSTYQVLAMAEDQGCGWVTADVGAKELTVRLAKDAPVSGRILDADGKPVAGAKLTVTGVAAAKGGDDGGFVQSVTMGSGYLKYAYGLGWVGPLPGQPAELTTGADGSFKVSRVGRDRVVSLRLEGRGIATAALGAHGDKFEYHAAVSRPIRGVVRDKDTGKPMAGVTVFSRRGINPRYEELGSPRAVTDKEGRYELLGLAKAPSYTLMMRPMDGLYFQRGVGLQDAPGLEALTADVEMVRGLTVRGKVTDKATGQPVAGALVEYYPLDANPNVNKVPGFWYPRSEATTGPDGSYALTVLPAQGVIGVIGPKRDAYMAAVVTAKDCKDFFKTPLTSGGDAMLWAVGNNSFGIVGHDQEPCHALVLLEPGEKEEGLVKDVALERPLERKGQVVGPDGEPLTGAMVFGLSPRVRGHEILRGAEFTVRGINPKATRQLLFFHKDKNLGFYMNELPGEKDGPITVKLQPCGAAFGRMVDRDGQPVAGMRLDFAGIVGAVGAPLQSVTTDKEGRFRVEGLVPGYSYPVTGLAPGVKYEQAPGFWQVMVQPGEKKDMGDIQAEKKR
jgi:protocatechuate 3,4-dioxygenase beta subunit